MLNFHSQLNASLSFKGANEIKLYAESGIEFDTLLVLDDKTAIECGEERIQLVEGAGYEYELPKGYSISCEKMQEIVHPSHASDGGCRGRITPNIYVGRLSLKILHCNTVFDEVAVEVRSVKTGYRKEYRQMLEDIAAECTDLLMTHSSPATQRFTVDHAASAETTYQRFAFVKSIVDSDEFRNAVNRIISMPVTGWSRMVENHDIRRARRIAPAHLRQIASRNDRVSLPQRHPLRSATGLGSLPSRLSSVIKIETVDTPENRFIKHALREFQRFCADVCRCIEEHGTENVPIYREAKELDERLGGYLDHSLFREVSPPRTLPLNSPVLQRKEGYREVLRVWLMFDLAAKLCWNALDDDQYHAGKRDVATLYEYWLFFKLLRIVQSVFEIVPGETEKLVESTKDRLGLQLKQGRHVVVAGEYIHNNRRLKVQFHYNRTFGKSGPYPAGGSWTQPMRPDYTLSIWPAEFSEKDAELQELIVHIHFDAKYKIEGLKYLISDNDKQGWPDNFDDLPEDEQLPWIESINKEKIEQKEGTYKRADLLKMHAYKDAIRRTAGAYVLYPGSEQYPRRGFHEIIPGLGAFPISPSNSDEGTKVLREFILEVVEHFTNRTTQREELSYYTFDVNREKRLPSSTKEIFPEKSNGYRVLPPQKTTVLVGYCTEDQHQWICKEHLYNIRIDARHGLVNYSPAVTGAGYLLLHGPGGLLTGDLWRIIGKAPTLISKEELKKRGYPKEPTVDHYIVFKIEKVDLNEFGNAKWDIRKLAGHSPGRKSTSPFAVTLQELLEAGITKTISGVP